MSVADRQYERQLANRFHHQQKFIVPAPKPSRRRRAKRKAEQFLNAIVVRMMIKAIWRSL